MLVSDYFEFHQLASWVARQTKREIGLVVGAGTLSELFDENAYAHLEGGLLEALGRLFHGPLVLYVYPLLDAATGRLTTVDTFDPGPRLRSLYQHLAQSGSIRPLKNYTPEHLPIFSRDVLAKIGRGDASWQAMVPPEVAAVIRERRSFGYRPERERPAA